MDRPTRLLLISRAARAYGYGLVSVLLASIFTERQFSGVEVGIVLGAMVGGNVIVQLLIARWADQWGRRRTYLTLYSLLVVAAALFATPAPVWLLVVGSLSGVLSVEALESGPFTTLELSMVSRRLGTQALAAGFGWYNAVAAAAGALGALSAGLPELTAHLFDGTYAHRVWFLLLIPVALSGITIALSLDESVEAPYAEGKSVLVSSRRSIARLSSLFVLDTFAGTIVVQAFIAFWLINSYQVSTATVGALFAAIGVVNAVSFLIAPKLSQRWGLLNTMVLTMLPGNIFLASVAFAPTFAIAAFLLLARAALSNMDIPIRQAYVIALVQENERTAATAYSNAARYIARPIAPPLSGALFAAASSAPFLVAGILKMIYAIALFALFRRVPLAETDGPNV